jgi:hypothetical protein
MTPGATIGDPMISPHLSADAMCVTVQIDMHEYGTAKGRDEAHERRRFLRRACVSK